MIFLKFSWINEWKGNQNNLCVMKTFILLIHQLFHFTSFSLSLRPLLTTSLYWFGKLNCSEQKDHNFLQPVTVINMCATFPTNIASSCISVFENSLLALVVYGKHLSMSISGPSKWLHSVPLQGCPIFMGAYLVCLSFPHCCIFKSFLLCLIFSMKIC